MTARRPEKSAEEQNRQHSGADSAYSGSESRHAVHTIPPIWDARAETLILGSFPSVRSRADAFYYAHPQNRFWRVLAAIYDCALPETAEEKTRLLLEHRLALWDVVAECEICGSSDSSIRRVQPNPIETILAGSRVRRIFVNGGTAAARYDRWLLPRVGVPAVRLPSTSPANAAWSLERLCAAWAILRLPDREPAAAE